jgi:hypothetical protein
VFIASSWLLLGTPVHRIVIPLMRAASEIDD